MIYTAAASRLAMSLAIIRCRGQDDAARWRVRLLAVQRGRRVVLGARRGRGGHRGAGVLRRDGARELALQPLLLPQVLPVGEEDGLQPLVGVLAAAGHLLQLLAQRRRQRRRVVAEADEAVVETHGRALDVAEVLLLRRDGGAAPVGVLQQLAQVGRQVVEVGVCALQLAQPREQHVILRRAAGGLHYRLQPAQAVRRGAVQDALALPQLQPPLAGAGADGALDVRERGEGIAREGELRGCAAVLRGLRVLHDEDRGEVRAAEVHGGRHLVPRLDPRHELAEPQLHLAGPKGAAVAHLRQHVGRFLRRQHVLHRGDTGVDGERAQRHAVQLCGAGPRQRVQRHEELRRASLVRPDVHLQPLAALPGHVALHRPRDGERLRGGVRAGRQLAALHDGRHGAAERRVHRAAEDGRVERHVGVDGEQQQRLVVHRPQRHARLEERRDRGEALPHLVRAGRLGELHRGRVDALAQHGDLVLRVLVLRGQHLQRGGARRPVRLLRLLLVEREGDDAAAEEVRQHVGARRAVRHHAADDRHHLLADVRRPRELEGEAVAGPLQHAQDVHPAVFQPDEHLPLAVRVRVARRDRDDAGLLVRRRGVGAAAPQRVVRQHRVDADGADLCAVHQVVLPLPHVTVEGGHRRLAAALVQQLVALHEPQAAVVAAEAHNVVRERLGLLRRTAVRGEGHHRVDAVGAHVKAELLCLLQRRRHEVARYEDERRVDIHRVDSLRRVRVDGEEMLAFAGVRLEKATAHVEELVREERGARHRPLHARRARRIRREDHLLLQPLPHGEDGEDAGAVTDTDALLRFFGRRVDDEALGRGGRARADVAACVAESPRHDSDV
ncbi:FG-GAP repeat protein [Strigomonas culicis]|uniref:FG-GAP repeat protein n=1 Tax=Strigomonas culicis TaxID=28005 RepID=S9W489_9TRYP|nr:FG-GAP repeat protein [Strigomonas culicis]|eukprot:EPY34156.1 FG-GAP repeat protein [Strigomonas culicis]